MPTIQTVLGEIDADTMGLTLPHEHLFVDLSCYWTGDALEEELRQRFDRPVTLENRADVLYNPWQYRDNTILDDMDSAIHEVLAFMQFGGSTIIDVTPYSLMGRKPEALKVIAQATGCQIVMSAGRYSGASMTEDEKGLSVDEITDSLLNEFKNGAGHSGIKPGLLKVGFENSLDKACEWNSLRAAARVQHLVGCALSVHPNIWQCESHKILDVIEDEGGNVQRTILCHQDFTGGYGEYHDSLAKRGAYLEFDTFGCECVTGQNDWNLWYPTDGQKITWVIQQIKLGNLDHLLISGDMCQKIFFSKWGGWGYAHIPEHIVPRLRSLGVTDEEIHRITVENPRRVFSY